MSEVNIENLTKGFGPAVRAIDELTLDIAEGELVVLLGPSGCGKTTLLRCLAGLERPDSGRIAIGGEEVFGGRREIPTHRRGIGLVFQNYALWPHMTVAQNVAYPLRAKGVSRRAREAAAREALALVECETLVDRLPAAISGGQQQRVALARAIVARPRLILFDEPLSNLDYRLRGQLRQEIRDLHRTLGFTGVYVTHDQTEAMQLGSRVVVLREGRIEQLAPPQELFDRPATSYVARFLGIGNAIALSRSDDRWVFGDPAVEIDLPHVPLPADSCELLLRAVDLTLAPPGSEGGADRVVVEGTVRDVLFGGDVSEWIVEVGGGTVLTATAAARTWPYAAGDRVAVQFELDDALLYAGPDGRLVEPVGAAA
ncbi:ABC transporter ATP-binding protein [Amycolatopsis sp. GM8]|uniref:ABC transporter ATP-binding protein n=1 Tax=Amycolatopsis sp. GM8 TaxID=2896530 RepID=UPI001F2C07CA|nr:ABC transporter ATP-binding protein [Amycolatopsis sp. GM8]